MSKSAKPSSAKKAKATVAKTAKKNAETQPVQKAVTVTPVADYHDANHQWGRRLMGILLVVFVLVLGINMVMVWFAVNTNTGVVSQNAYQEGLDYNKTLAEQAKEAGLGWRVVRNVADFPDKLVYALSGPQGNPLGTAWVHVKATRPMGDAEPFEKDLQEYTDGTYAVDMPWPKEGQWDLETTFVYQGKALVARERVSVH